MTVEKSNPGAQDSAKKDPKEIILETTAKEYFDSAEDDLGKGRHNAAVVLFFKSLVALSDLYLFRHTGDTPSSHTRRFSMTRERFPDIYDLLDKDFPFYQDSYVRLMSKELAEAIKDDAKVMAEKTGTEL